MRENDFDALYHLLNFTVSNEAWFADVPNAEFRQ